MVSSNDSYDFVVFNILAYEFPSDDPQEFNQKIRRALGRKRLGTYDGDKVQMLRTLKNYLQDEFRAPQNSKYYVGSNSPTSAIIDFDQTRLGTDIRKSFPLLSSEDVGRIVSLSIYLYYLR